MPKKVMKLGELVSKKRGNGEMTPNNEPPPPNVAPGAPSRQVQVAVPVRREYTPEQQKMNDLLERQRISPLKDGEGKITDLTGVMDRISADGFQDLFDDAANPEQAKILLFFYARKLFAEDDPRRISEITRMLSPPTNGAETRLRARILRLIRLDSDVLTPSGHAHTLAWKSMATEYGLVAGEHGCNIFSSHSVKMMQRVQHGQNCFLHASVVTQAYKVQAPNPVENSQQMVDICKFVRQSYSCEKLLNFLDDKGGDSRDTLTTILYNKETRNIQGDVAMSTEFNTSFTSEGVTSCPLKDLLELHGPALVSMFRLEKRFYQRNDNIDNAQPELSFFDGELIRTAANDKTRHAMVLVGTRLVGDEWRLLLQNWWPNMQFVEVSREYFLSCEAVLTFVDGVQDKIPERYDRCNASYAEAEMEGGDIHQLVLG
jgi:hypothetical protein